MNLSGKKILIGITGSIAAYKMPLLVRELKKQGADIRVICTSDALNFVTAPTLATVSGNPVYTQFFKNDQGEWINHVDLALWADLILIAPATANTIAKLAHGVSDNLLITTVMSARCTIAIAPAMDHDMLKYPATNQNLEKLQSYGHYIIPSEHGELASGLIGQGRLPDEQTLLNHIEYLVTRDKKFEGKTVLVSAGPTQEAIDPVRYVSNHSTGKMGVAIAKAFALQGAKVYLVHGPISLQLFASIKGLDIDTIETLDSASMNTIVSKLFKNSDICVMSAAVADYKPTVVAKKKIKKKENSQKLELVKTVDILNGLGAAKKKGQTLVGFALETDHEEKNALDKLQKKNLDMIVLNSLNEPGAGFQFDTNQVTIYTLKSSPLHIPLKHKNEIAWEITHQIYQIRK